MNAQPYIKETAFIPEGPQPLMREIPPGDPFPVHALGPLRAAVEAVQDVTQATLGDVNGQGFLTARQRAEVGHRPVEANQAQQAFDEPCRLP